MNRTQLEASEALLDIGVSLPLWVIKIPFTRKSKKIRVVMRRPCLGNQIRIARHYLQLGTTYDQMVEFSKEEEMEFLAKHGKRVSKMIALTVCRGYFSGRFLAPVLALLIRWFVADSFIQAANLEFITLLGTRSFLNIIRSAELTNPMKPKLSQREKGS